MATLTITYVSKCGGQHINLTAAVGAQSRDMNFHQNEFASLPTDDELRVAVRVILAVLKVGKTDAQALSAFQAAPISLSL